MACDARATRTPPGGHIVHRRACSVAALAATALAAVAAASGDRGVGHRHRSEHHEEPVRAARRPTASSSSPCSPPATGRPATATGSSASPTASAPRATATTSSSTTTTSSATPRASCAATARRARSSRSCGSIAGRCKVEVRLRSDQPGRRSTGTTSAQSWSGPPSPGGVNPRNPADIFPAQFAPFDRFCSSSLTDPGQLYNQRTGRGYAGQIYFANEEGGDEAGSSA